MAGNKFLENSKKMGIKGAIIRLVIVVLLSAMTYSYFSISWSAAAIFFTVMAAIGFVTLAFFSPNHSVIAGIRRLPWIFVLLLVGGTLYFVVSIPASFGLRFDQRLAMGVCFIISVLGSEVFCDTAKRYIAEKKKTSRKLW